MAGKNQIIVNGYSFKNAEDAALAETERKKVEYLRSHLKNADPDKVHAVYTKALSDNLFRTPIGMDFLRELRQYLVEDCDYTENEVIPIPVDATYTDKQRANLTPARKRIDTEKKKEKVPVLYISIVLNILLVIAVIAMFYITLHSDNPNILNYETALNDKYSYWAEQLTEKDSQLRQKEQELNLREEDLDIREDDLNAKEDELNKKE